MMRVVNLVKLFTWLFVAVYSAATAAAQPVPGKRVALVIGVGEYSDVRKLSSAVRDAYAVEAALRKLGFKVVVEPDRSKRRLSTALDDFVEDNRGADLALVFFAGHGVQISGRNFLLPTDAVTSSTAAIEASSLSLDTIVDRISDVARRKIVLLDACRNDPFKNSTWDAGNSILPGLAKVQDANWTIYGFAAAAGATASDGTATNSPFTEALIQHLGKSGLELGSILKLVQMEVYERSYGRQIPHVEDGLPERVYIGGSDPLQERDRLLFSIAGIDDDTRAQVERIAMVHGVPLAPLYGALIAAAVTSSSDYSNREIFLTRAAEDFVKVRNELRTLASSDPDVARLRAQAEHDLSLGNFEAARDLLTRAIEIDRHSGEQLEARLKERNLSEAANLSMRAGIASTRLAYRDAATDLSAAADLAERWDKTLAWRYRISQGNMRYRQGGEFGDNAALIDAIEINRRALALAPRLERPEDWAATQDNLGNALITLGVRESGKTRLEEAVAAFHLALEERARERMPLEWASTQNNLANALLALGERESGTERLE
jgi:uncharacterized caspase-like protein